MKMLHPLDGYLEAKANRGRYVVTKTDGDSNKVFLCGILAVVERGEATHYTNTREPPPPGFRYELA